MMKPAAVDFIRGERIVLPDGTQAATVHIQDGRIAAVRAYHDVPAGMAGLDAGELVILPGLVDPHVHINEPGRTEWEGFAHATRAAAAGGVTTLVDMPLNSIPATVSVAGFDAKHRASEGEIHVDVGFWGGVVPGNTPAIRPLAASGVLGFKSFLSPSGVDEFPHVAEADLRAALPVLAALDMPLLVHAELPALLQEADPAGDPRVYRTWLETRPVASEVAAIDLLIELARESGARIHVVHLSSPAPLAAIRAARASGVAISCETCPHYLTFDEDHIVEGATPFKCAPPIRSSDDREGLWRGLTSGAIDLVATDHSPAPPGSSTSTTAISCKRGAASRRFNSASRPCGRERRCEACRSNRWHAGWQQRPRCWRASNVQRAPSRSAGTPTSSSGIPTSSRSSTRPRCTIVMRLRPTRG